MADSVKYIPLPAPSAGGDRSLEQLLEQRRSVRDFIAAPLSLREAGQLLWAAQGISDPHGLRTAPSAGALYPLELYLVAGAVDDLSPGLYHYEPEGHRLVQTAGGDRRGPLAKAALGQSWLADAAAVVAFAGILERTSRKYGARAERYVHIEVGHAAENLFLQAQALGLGTVVVGAFDDDAVAEVLQLPAATRPYLLMPVGHPGGD
jgi:SagB-type dehydrogenase family enzyme